MVTLDLGGDAGDAGGFDDVGVDGALGEPAGALDLPGVLVEGLHEQAADDLPLGLGLGDAGEGVEEGLGGVDPDDVQAHVLVRGEDVLELVLPEEPVRR